MSVGYIHVSSIFSCQELLEWQPEKWTQMSAMMDDQLVKVGATQATSSEIPRPDGPWNGTCSSHTDKELEEDLDEQDDTSSTEQLESLIILA